MQYLFYILSTYCNCNQSIDQYSQLFPIPHLPSTKLKCYSGNSVQIASSVPSEIPIAQLTFWGFDSNKEIGLSNFNLFDRVFDAFYSEGQGSSLTMWGIPQSGNANNRQSGSGPSNPLPPSLTRRSNLYSSSSITKAP